MCTRESIKYGGQSRPRTEYCIKRTRSESFYLLHLENTCVVSEEYVYVHIWDYLLCVCTGRTGEDYGNHLTYACTCCD